MIVRQQGVTRLNTPSYGPLGGRVRGGGKLKVTSHSLMPLSKRGWRIYSYYLFHMIPARGPQTMFSVSLKVNQSVERTCQQVLRGKHLLTTSVFQQS